MKKALGKGLSALIPDTYVKKEAVEKLKKSDEQLEEKVAKTKEKAIAPQREKKDSVKASHATSVESSSNQEGFQVVNIDLITPNPEQPRKIFSDEGIEELAASIQEKGILQPIIVSRATENEGFVLICGERRYRAAQKCGIKQIPVIVKDLADSEFLEWGLIENIQREDLNAIEEASAYQKLVDENGLSQEEVAKRVGKSRVTITNMLRLLRLPESVRQYLAGGQLSSGHARALLGLMTPEHQRQLAKRIVEENLSVRQVEAIVGRSNAHKRKAKTARSLTPEIVDLETKLSHHFGTQVKLYPRKNQKEGRIEIQYFSLDDLDRVLEKAGISKDV